MRLPDLKALSYPISTNVPLEFSAGPNNMYLGRESVLAEGFVPPFANQAMEESRLPPQAAAAARAQQHFRPEASFAGTGDLTNLQQVTFGTVPNVYKEIAQEIRGHAASETQPPSMPERRADDTPPPSLSQVVSSDKLYGAGPRDAMPSFMHSCQRAVQGLVYDFLHWDDVAASLEERHPVLIVKEVCTRHGRGPYLLFCVLAVVMLLVLLMQLFSSSSSQRYYVLLRR